MKNRWKQLLAVGLASAVMLSTAACTSGGSSAENASGAGGAAKKEPVTLKITWWGSQQRHTYTKEMLAAYTKEHPDVQFDAVPAGWDGYFDKLSTQAASGSMPDIVQMDYLYISTYAKNNSLADLQPFMDDKTIDTSKIAPSILKTGKTSGKMVGVVLSTSLLSCVYNPDVLAKAGLQAPAKDWTWDDYVKQSAALKAKGIPDAANDDPTYDTNIFNYWVRQHGQKLFSDDNRSIGYQDDKILVDYLKMWKKMMDENLAPTPDEYSQIASLPKDASPLVKNEAAFSLGWNNSAVLSAKANDKLKLTEMPKIGKDDKGGLWMKPGMFFSVAQTSKHQKEAAEFINWFVNSEEANNLMMAERGTPVNSEIRAKMIDSGKMSPQQKDMFQYVDEAAKIVGETPAADPVGMAEINKLFKDTANAAFYGQKTPEQAAADFRSQANEVLARNN